jgi:hypothetical protein
MQLTASHRIERFENTPPISNSVSLRLAIRNGGKRVAKYVLALIRFPAREHLEISLRWGALERIDDLHPGRQARQYSEALGVIHPYSDRRIAELTLRVGQEFAEKHLDDPFIDWTIYADEMAPRAGMTTLRELGYV